MSRGSLLFWLVVLCIGVAMFSLVWGAPISVFDLNSASPEKREVARAIFLSLRPTRVAAALLVGASLSVAGAGLQTLFRNPLAEPYLLGISAGGALGATIASAFKLPLWLGVDAAMPLAWFGSVGAGFLVFALGRSDESSFDSGSRRARLLLVGVALSAFLSALLSLVVALSGSADLAQETAFWLLGGLSRAGAVQNIVLAVSLISDFCCCD